MPQNPIQKAHLEGVKSYDYKRFEQWLAAAYEQLSENEIKDISNWIYFENKSFLTTYAESILNAALEAGPGEVEQAIKQLYEKR